MERFTRDGLTFPVRDGGPADGAPVLLLHGWPSGAASWDAVAPLLHARGHRTLVPEQRGYAASARPHPLRAYTVPELVDDALALLDAADVERAHVVGHDWGGAVAWAIAAAAPERVRTLTVLSTPHPAAIREALARSDQALRSLYVALFQVPVLPERLLAAGNGAVLRTLLRRSGLRRDLVDRIVDRQLEPGALAGGLAWYRALRLPASQHVGAIAVPTRFVWSTGDPALGRVAAERTADHVTGPYRFDVLDGVDHWLPEQHAELVAEAVAEQVAEHAS